MPGIRQGDRVLAVGNTGEGKSEVLAHLFAIHTGQRLLLDVNDDYELGPAAVAEGACEADHPSQVDWRMRTIRYTPRSLSPSEFNDLYRLIFARGQLLVWLDEAEDAAPSPRAPLFVRKTVKQGRKRWITHCAATQRPHGVDRSVINQSEHAFVFRMVDPDDIDALTFRLHIGARELAHKLGELPEHGYLYHRLGQPQILVMPALPPAILKQTRRHVIIPSQ